MRELTTPRTTLEPLVAAHAQAMFPLLADAALYRWLDDAPPPSLDAQTKLILQKEGLTVNLGKRSDKQIKEDMEYYESILARQGAPSEAPLEDDAPAAATTTAK